MKSRKMLIAILSCVVFVALTTLITAYFVTDYIEKKQMHTEQQYIFDVLQYIDNQHKLFDMAENNRPRKVIIYNEVYNYQVAFESGEFKREEISTRFAFVLSSMIDSFVDNYNEMIDEVEAAASDSFYELQKYIAEILSKINNIAENINTAEELVEMTELAHILIEIYQGFTTDGLLNDFTNEINTFIEELQNIRVIIESDAVLTDLEKLDYLYEKVEGLINTFNEDLNRNDFNEVRDEYNVVYEIISTSIFDYYAILINEISERENLNGDIESIEQKIEELHLLKTDISQNIIMTFDMLKALGETFDALIENFTQELDALKEAAEQTPPPSTPGQTPGQNPNQPPAQTPGQTPPAQNPSPPPADVNVTWLISEVLRLTNVERENNGLSALSGSHSTLNSAAAIRAEEIVASFSHTRPDGRSPFSAYTDLGGSYSFLGENIAFGYRSASGVVQGWMDSQGHKENILNTNYTHLGIGVAVNSEGRIYWVQLFMG